MDPSGNAENATMVLVAIVVVVEAVKFLWPLLRHDPPDLTPGRLDALLREQERLRLDFGTHQATELDTYRSVMTLLDHSNKQFDLLRRVLELSNELHGWHNVTDPKTGGKMWYVPSSVHEGIASMIQVSNQQSDLLRDLDRTLRTFLTVQQELNRRLTENPR